MSQSVLSVSNLDQVIRASVEVAPRGRQTVDGNTSDYGIARSIANVKIASLDDLIAIGMVLGNPSVKDVNDAVRQDTEEARRSFLGQRSASHDSGCTGCAGLTLEQEYKAYRRTQNFALARVIGEAQERVASPWDRVIDIVRRVAENSLQLNFRSFFADVITVGDGSELTFSNINFINANQIVAAKDAVINLPQVAFLKTESFTSN